MSRNLYIGIGVVVVIVLLMVGGGFLRPPGLYPIPHGYDGIVSNIVEIDHDYDDFTTYNDFYWAGIDPSEPYPLDPTGIRAQISSPQYIKSEDYQTYTSEERYIENGVEYVREYTQQATIFTFEMSMNLQTYQTNGVGQNWIENVIFWIELKNNDFTVFSNPDDTAIAVLSVIVIENEVLQRGAGFEIDPEGTGFDVPLYTTEHKETTVPAFAGDVVNLDNFRLLSQVRIPIRVVQAAPILNTQAQIFMKFHITVLVLGEWEKVRPWYEVEPPPPQLTPWEWLLLQISKIPELLFAPIGALVVVVGIIGSVILVIKLRGPLVFLGLVVVWIGVFIVLLMLGVWVVL